MKRFILPVLVLFLFAFPALAGTEEFTVTPASDHVTIPLNQPYDHFMIAASADVEIRFLIPQAGPQGQINLHGTPLGGTDTKVYPTNSDTTITVFSSEGWNIFNDVRADRINIHGGSGTTLTIRCKN